MNRGLYSIPKNRTYDTKYHTLVESASYASTASSAVSSSYAYTASIANYADTANYANTANSATTAGRSLSPLNYTGSTLYSTDPAAGANISANDSIYLGYSAGQDARNSYGSNFLGYIAGLINPSDTGSNYYSNYLGYSAGAYASAANNSNFFGYYAGRLAISASNSNFFGNTAGARAVSASYSTLMGYNVGRYPNVESGSLGIKSNNIIIGTNITLPNRRQDSINIGGILFGTGSYFNTSSTTPFSGSAGGRIGINVVTPQYTLDVSGSGNYSNGLTVTGSLNASNVTGSLQGTSSWAVNAVTASHAPSYVLNSATSSMLSPYALSSALNSYVQNSVTASMLSPYALSTALSSYVLTSATSSMAVATASYVTASNVIGTVTSASYALTSSYAANGGVTQIVAGTNITITNGGSGSVTINSSGGSGGAGANITASFTNQSTWTFTHALGNRGVVVQTFDTSWNQIIPENITLTDANTATITFPTAESGFAIATLGGTTSIVNASSSISASFASTASFVTPYEGAWISYTPAWTSAGTQPSLGDGTLTGAYKQIGKTVFVRVRLAFGSTTSGGTGAWQFGLPVTASIAAGIQLPCSLLDNTNAWYQAVVNGEYAGDTWRSALIAQSAGGANSSQGVDATFPFTWGNADSLQFNGSYEAA